MLIRCVAAPMSDPQGGGAPRCQRSMSAAVGVAVMQRPVECGDQVVGVFEANGEANQPIEPIASTDPGR